MTHELAAAIDLGTNTALCLVARLDSADRCEIVEDHCLMPRLGGAAAADGTLNPEAVERALAALEFFAGRLAELNVRPERVRAVSTAVLRRAPDARAFVELARARSGLALEIISGDEEARLGRIAVRAEGATDATIVIDVGGGSTEVSCAELQLRVSLPIGAVVLAAVRPRATAQARIDAAVAGLPAHLADGRDVIVLGGTGVNLACLALGLARFDHERAEGVRVDAQAAREFAQRLAALSLPERLALPIEAARADILPEGMAVLAGVLERLGAKNLRVTGRGLRFGVVRELLESR
ncbi:MAG: hypothetical protein JNL28_05790 [Planctomycetes bacterium]|nr:hypothetical protein [Planctomycetota bacterium]